ncbi:uncharacterized protein MKK02DRAFT_45819 [Dioszegia hungarica]|uniref:Stress-response A/B barrel domain-containing protein n=1 Tax=Dioszegia hungarica TaxID=4972 RepID=A0AA38LW35_9TREE|nr:uncharacterized protein MKK02DRAFT_45819 [Dioszegia hungarica]KAI9637108.1 hypothetical protein MKK02DRAFT_45819 [Dioszegia hungarica]
MSFFHIVSFSTPDESTLAALTTALRELEETVITSDGRKAIKSFRGGKQVSEEGHDKGMKVVFLMEFASDEDLQWYLWKDPAHLKFKSRIKSDFQVDGVTVLDFQDGSY